ncbi:hypothetical protein O181_027219 [Austropuccinia psidii MF-1]|uniref:Uncharacterized protein n=1 Tax=Austropuccinia psidii MF-1 TaxID=1389203 RepID=A0A9Q3CNP2_9BASI|nr:hypothetical protein [Austropuccinia psidii MF-1]
MGDSHERWECGHHKTTTDYIRTGAGWTETRDNCHQPGLGQQDRGDEDSGIYASHWGHHRRLLPIDIQTAKSFHAACRYEDTNTRRQSPYETSFRLSGRLVGFRSAHTPSTDGDSTLSCQQWGTLKDSTIGSAAISKNWIRLTGDRKAIYGALKYPYHTLFCNQVKPCPSVPLVATEDKRAHPTTLWTREIFFSERAQWWRISAQPRQH